MAGPASYVEFAAGYDLVLGRLAERTWRQGVLAELASLRRPDRGLVADLGAGTGIGGRLLREAGIATGLVGIDRSAPMLRQATRWYAVTVLADAASLPLATASAGLIVSGFDSLNYLPPEALGRCLAEAGRCLVPGGWLVFDYSSPVLIRGRFGQVIPVPGGAVALAHRYQPDHDRAISVVEHRPSGGPARWREEHFQYAVGADRLRALAGAAGLRVERVRDLNRAQFSPGAHAHVWVLHREPAPGRPG